MSYANPFASRASEHTRDPRSFTRTYAVEVLDVVPPLPWEQLIALHSAPGAGKTSLMRIFTSESLRYVSDRGEPAALHSRLTSLGAIVNGEPALLGVLMNLSEGYRSLLDLGVGRDHAQRLFFRLLDARLVIRLLQAACDHARLTFPDDVQRVNVLPDSTDVRAHRSLERLGGSGGADLFGYAQASESDLLDLFETLADPAESVVPGHAELHLVRALSGARIAIDGRTEQVRPVLLFDDGHELAPSQREALLHALRDRRLDLSRWYAQRLEALDPSELLAGSPGRDDSSLVLDRAFRSRTSGRGALTPSRYTRLLLGIANARADPILQRHTSQDFEALIDHEPDAALMGREPEVLAALRQAASAAADGDHRYERWLDGTDTLAGRDGAARLGELAVLIRRDQNRLQGELFDIALDPGDLASRGSSALREAAWLDVCRSFRLPYYSGPEALTRLASANVEQFLSIAGELFGEVLADLAVDRDPNVNAARQDRVLRRVSEEYYKSIRKRTPGGQFIQRFVTSVANIHAAEAKRPTVPYPPGITGTALSMTDRAILMDPERRRGIRGADQLYMALAEAVAHNILWVENDYSNKNGRWMVIYLNRLLCPRFDMPLGLGGFRERTLKSMTAWMIDDAGNEDGQGTLL